MILVPNRYSCHTTCNTHFCNVYFESSSLFAGAPIRADITVFVSGDMFF